MWQWLSLGPQHEEAQVTLALFTLALNWIITSGVVCMIPPFSQFVFCLLLFLLEDCPKTSLMLTFGSSAPLFVYLVLHSYALMPVLVSLLACFFNPELYLARLELPDFHVASPSGMWKNICMHFCYLLCRRKYDHQNTIPLPSLINHILVVVVLEMFSLKIKMPELQVWLVYSKRGIPRVWRIFTSPRLLIEERHSFEVLDEDRRSSQKSQKVQFNQCIQLGLKGSLFVEC